MISFFPNWLMTFLMGFLEKKEIYDYWEKMGVNFGTFYEIF